MSLVLDWKSEPIRLLCVDDQPIIGEAIRRLLASAKDIEFHYCQHALEVLEKVQQIRPTVILQDLIMPDKDGLEVLEALRKEAFGAQVPVILLSAKEDPLIKVRAFELGATDYIIKIPSAVELLARVRYHAQAYRLQNQRDALHQSLVHQLRQAGNYVLSLLPVPLEGPLKTDWVFLPSKTLGGDALDCFYITEDLCVFYLLDVCDHGVGPALLSVSVMNLLRSAGALPLESPSALLAALNARFPMSHQESKFFTLWYGVYHVPSRTLTYASAGHPPALLLTQEGPLQPLSTKGIAIGIVPEFSYTQASCVLPEKSSLFLFSDGVYELFSNGQLLGLGDLQKELLAVFQKTPDASLEALVHRMRTLQGRPDFDDDFSILRVQV